MTRHKSTRDGPVEKRVAAEDDPGARKNRRLTMLCADMPAAKLERIANNRMDAEPYANWQIERIREGLADAREGRTLSAATVLARIGAKHGWRP